MRLRQVICCGTKLNCWASAVAREAKDLLLKLQAAGLGGGFLASLGINLPPIVAALPAELPTLEVRVEQPDSLFRLANRAILHFEFQNTKDAADLRRFYRYQYAVSEFYDTEVHTVVLYGPGITEAPEILRRGSAVYTVHNVFIGLQDGERNSPKARRWMKRIWRASSCCRLWTLGARFRRFYETRLLWPENSPNLNAIQL